MTEPEYFTPQQVAAMTQHHVQTVFGELRSGRLRGSQPKKRGHWRVHRDDMAAWMRGERPGLRAVAGRNR